MHDRGDSVFDLDRSLLRRAFERAALSYDQAAVVQREVGARLLERLDLIKLKPTMVVDIGCATGAITAMLLKKYRQAQVVCLELSPGMVAAARKRASWLRPLRGVVGEPETLPLANASCDLIFSNLALPWCLDFGTGIRGIQAGSQAGWSAAIQHLGAGYPDRIAVRLASRRPT